MRALLQRVSEAQVLVEGTIVGEISRGIVVLLGVRKGDSPSQADILAHKIAHLRIFNDEAGKMNRSSVDTQGELLIVSQFTLYADTQKGNRPSFSEAESPVLARTLYDAFVASCRKLGLKVETGIFQAHMQLRLVNDGPVTLLCSSESEQC